jgi:methanogenic corrinoid protein MtbC1
MQKTLLSTADIARLFNVTETTVKRWSDDGTLKCQKTPGGHRKFDIKQLVEFANAIGLDPTGTLSLDQDQFAPAIQVAVLERNLDTLSTIFVEKALSADRHDLHDFLSYLYQHRFQLWEICDFIIQRGFADIGSRWKKSEINIYHEHRASHETLDALARLQMEIIIKPTVDRQAVCACFEDEMHDIGLRCAANIIESEGWTVHFLGNRTPYRALVECIHDLHPDLVCLSTTYTEMTAGMVARLKDVRRLIHRSGGKLVLGGQKSTSKLHESGCCDVMFDAMKQLVEYIQSPLFAGPSPRVRK